MRKYLQVYETIWKGTDDEPIWVYDSEILNMKVGSIYQVLVTEIPCFFTKKGLKEHLQSKIPNDIISL